MTNTLSRPPVLPSNIRRVAILFAGGPAPAANAVISTAAVSFLRNNIDVVGVLHGYSNLVQYGPEHPMQEDRDYVRLSHHLLRRSIPPYQYQTIPGSYGLHDHPRRR